MDDGATKREMVLWPRITTATDLFVTSDQFILDFKFKGGVYTVEFAT